MAPSGRTKTTRRRKPSRSRHCKKQHPRSKKQEISAAFSASCSSISSKDSSNDRNNMDSEVAAEVISTTTSACSTPKGQKFRIPEVSTCPPAPKKPRVVSNCSLRRSPVALFAPPDLDIFFCVALPDVSVSFVC